MIALEVFETDDDTVVTRLAAIEDARRAAFEEGRAAGRAEAEAEARSARALAEAEAVRCLQDLSFTFHEARAHVLAALSPLFHQIATPLLPAIARETLAPMIAGVLEPMAEGMADAPIRLAFHPEASEAVERLAAECPFPLTTLRDEGLPAGAVRLRLGEVETGVDLTRATHEITAAIRGFFAPQEQERMYG